MKYRILLLNILETKQIWKKIIVKWGMLEIKPF